MPKACDRSLKRFRIETIDPYLLHWREKTPLLFAVKKGGKTTITGRIVVAADGKSHTVTATRTDPSGKKVKTKLVYDKAS